MAAKEAAIKSVGSEEGDIEETTPTLLLMPPMLSEPVYTQKDLHMPAQLQAKPDIPGGWYQLPDERILLPEVLRWTLIQ